MAPAQTDGLVWETVAQDPEALGDDVGAFHVLVSMTPEASNLAPFPNGPCGTADGIGVYRARKVHAERPKCSIGVQCGRFGRRR
jgi:hypothetical protein